MDSPEMLAHIGELSHVQRLLAELPKQGIQNSMGLFPYVHGM